jgi:hypothetical protein
MSTASLNGQRVTSALVTVPKWGAWYADVGLDVERTITGTATLKISDVTFIGTVLSGGASNGRSSFRIVGGSGGWGKAIPAASEADDAGVKVATILTSVALAAGETLDASTLPGTRLGPHWARHAGPARDALELVVPGAWYVGEDGMTRIGARASKAWAGKAATEPVDKARGSVVIAPETLVGLVPGAIVSGVEAVDVWHAVADGKVRSTVWGSLSSSSSRRLTAWRRLFDALDPGWRFRGVYEYRVVLLSGERLDLQPVRVSSGMPDLRRVPVSAGVAGAKSTVLPGARVFVSFADQSPSRPIVIGFEDADGSGFKPVSTTIDAATFVKLADGIRPMGATGDLAGGIWPLVGTTRVLG